MKNTNFTEITSRLLKIEDVQNIQTPTPFFDILSKNQNDLWLLGTQHTHDQNNFQIPILEKWFKDEGVDKLETLYLKHILKFQPDKRVSFKGSSLERLFKKLKA